MIDKVNLMIVDSDLLFGECLASVLSGQEYFSSVEWASDPTDVLAKLEDLQPGIVVININLPGDGALTLTRRIRSEYSRVKVIMIGLADADSLIMKCIEAGASGYLLEGDSFNQLLETIFSVNRGETICSPTVAYYSFSRLADLSRDRHDQAVFEDAKLTTREMEILQLIVDDMSNKQIAQHLILSLYTVKNHVHNILGKLRVRNRSAASDYAMNHGIRRKSAVRFDRSSVLVLAKTNQR